MIRCELTTTENDKVVYTYVPEIKEGEITLVNFGIVDGKLTKIY